MRHSLAIAVLCGLAATVSADPVVWDNGDPPGSGAWASQMPLILHADDFALDAGANTITGVHWWGQWLSYPPPPDSRMDIAIFADAGGEPTGGGMSDPTETALKIWRINYSDVTDTYDPGLDMYAGSVDVSFDPFVATPGETYWISVYQNGDYGMSNWLWAGSSLQTGSLGMYIDLEGFTLQWDTRGSDFAFQLTGIPEPGSLLLLALGAGLALRRRV